MTITLESGGAVTLRSGGGVDVTAGGATNLKNIGATYNISNTISTFAQRVTDAAITGGVTTSVGFDSNVSTVYIDRYVIIDPYTVGAEIGLITGVDTIAPVINATFDNSHSSGVPVLIVDRGAYLQAEWFGLDEGGSASNNSTALADFTAAVKATTLKGQLPAGNFDIGSTWTISETAGIDIIGVGSFVGGTKLRWRGADLGTGVLIEDSREGRIGGFRLHIDNASFRLNIGVRMQNAGAGGAQTPTQMIIDEVYIDNDTAGWMTRGFSIDDAGAGGDFNNEYHILRRCQVKFAQYGFYLDGFNIYNIQFERCTLTGDSTGGTSDYGVYCLSGSFNWINGSSNYMDEADFYRSANGGPCFIIGHNSEHSAGFYLADNGAGGTTGGTTPDFITNVRWERGDNALALRANDRIVEVKTGGPVTITNSVFRSYAGESPVIYILQNSANLFSSLILDGVIVDTDQTDPAQVFVSFGNNGRLVVKNCQLQDSGGNYVLVTDFSVGGNINVGPATELTIATGAITKTRSYHTVDTEADASTDDLATINGGTVGDILYVTAANDARTVVAKDGTGNLQLAGDCTLDSAQDTLTLLFDGTNWLELSRSNNGA